LSGDDWAFVRVRNDSTNTAYGFELAAEFFTEKGIVLEQDYKWGNEWVWLNPGQEIFFADYFFLTPASEMLGLPIGAFSPSIEAPVGWVVDGDWQLGVESAEVRWTLDGRVLNVSAELKNVSEIPLATSRTDVVCFSSGGAPTFFGLDFSLGDAVWDSSESLLVQPFPPGETFELVSSFEIVSAGEIVTCDTATPFFPPEFVDAGRVELEQLQTPQNQGSLPQWEFLGESVLEGSILTVTIYVSGTPNADELEALARPVIEAIRKTETYSGLEVQILGDIPGAESADGATMSLGRYLDTPYGLRLDQVEDEDYASYEVFVINGQVAETDWANWRTEADLEIWRAASEYRIAARNRLSSCIDGDIGCWALTESQGALDQASDLGVPVEDVLLAIQRVRDSQDFKKFVDGP